MTRILIIGGQGLVTLWLVTVVIFLIPRLTGSPADALLPIQSTRETRDRIEAELGLDRPLPVQYGKFMAGAIRGDFGTSIRTQVKVTPLIMDRLPNSIALATAAVGFAIIVAVPIGVIAAVNAGSKLDRALMLFPVLGQTLPTFWSGILAIFIFGTTLELLPSQSNDVGNPTMYVLPAITLGWFMGAGLARLLRSGMLEVLDSEYIKFARSKGLKERAVIWNHAFRNALIPVVTFIGFMYGTLIASAISTEAVFGWPGIGSLAFSSVVTRDFPLLQGVVIVSAALIIAINMLVDVIYGVLDPRIRV